MSTNALMWIGFNLFVVVMLALDLGVFHRKQHTVKVKEALIWSAIWITLALVFNVGIYYTLGQQKALEFLTGYVVEKSLSIDNLFVFILLFGFFKVESKLQHRVLFWGVLGAIVLRAIFIFAGVALINQFHWIIYIFGAFLIYTGIKMLFEDDDKEVHPDKNPVVKWVKRIYPVASNDEKGSFFRRIDKKLHITPLFIVLLLIEISDLIFAVDSIPAILSISNDTYIVFTSNIFAIMGLRSLYFAVSEVMGLFRYLKFGLAAILAFVGIKMCISSIYEIPISVSLLFILGTVTISVLLSKLIPAEEKA
ncbi:TerC family protein [Acetobacteroides hydrogenigenes]|uniref:Tellurite resistance protein TerC n=1 Tax=Acetobacteroides hydrogenigenes TaxID=979970 RepID=A0A4V2RPU1_9BACT|nr:TerC family protein [Acetobacteroides hydrogenigenes]TCN68930.1 tellurite resistance protein TerC [Acetobacteroides hydrogenigenes]